MKEKIKIGLSRSRLFDFQNVVSFVGEISEPLDLKELTKALKMLSIKEPLITSVICLDETFEAYVQTESIQPEIEVVNEDIDSFLKEQINIGLDFRKNLFRFFVINENTLVILSHTVVSDSKSLLILAKELISFYNKASVDALPKPIKLFSEECDLPLEVDSFVADRVTEVLDNNYLLKPKKFNYDDYINAKQSFSKKFGEVGLGSYIIDDELCSALKEKCLELKIDFSSMLLFALTEALKTTKKTKKKDRKVNLCADRRPFFVDRELYSVGCFNGNVTLDIADKTKYSKEPLKAFHENLYKKLSVCFNVFYNELFLSKLTPSFLDSCFMYKAGVYKNKYTKKLATLYFSEQQFLCSFEAVNLNQRFWENLSTFHHVRVKEPHKSNFFISFSLVMGEKNELFVEWNSKEITKAQIDALIEKTISFLKQQ